MLTLLKLTSQAGSLYYVIKRELIMREKGTTSTISIFRDLALVIGVISSLIGFGPQIVESFNKLMDAKRQHTLYSAYFDYGQDLFQSEHYSDSIQAFEEAIKLRPNDISVQVMLKKARLMNALYNLHEINKSELPKLSFEVEFVIKSKPRDIFRFYYVQGNIRYFLNDFEGARTSFEEALACSSRYGPALANLGATLNVLKRHDEAVKMLQTALESGYIEPAVYNNLILALRSLGKNIEAISVAKEALNRFPAHAGIHNELGIALYRIGRMEDALSELKTAFIMTSKKDTNQIVERLVNLSYPLADIGQIKKALSYLQSAKELLPENPNIYLAEAHCHNITKNDKKALEAYEKITALGYYPDPDELLKWANILQRLERLKEASKILIMTLEKSRENKQLMTAIRALAKKLGDQEILYRLDEIESAKEKNLNNINNAK